MESKGGVPPGPQKCETPPSPVLSGPPADPPPEQQKEQQKSPRPPEIAGATEALTPPETHPERSVSEEATPLAASTKTTSFPQHEKSQRLQKKSAQAGRALPQTASPGAGGVAGIEAEEMIAEEDATAIANKDPKREANRLAVQKHRKRAAIEAQRKSSEIKTMRLQMQDMEARLAKHTATLQSEEIMKQREGVFMQRKELQDLRQLKSHLATEVLSMFSGLRSSKGPQLDELLAKAAADSILPAAVQSNISTAEDHEDQAE